MHKSHVVLAVFGATIVGTSVFAGPAAAHVTVEAAQPAQRGSYARVVFRVPNESDAASTTKLEVYLPEDQPLSSVRTQPVAGWSVELTRTTLSTPLESHGREITEAVTKITWTASEGVEIKPDQFQEFPVSLGRLPDADRMVFKVIQTYSDGEIARWIEEPVGNEEPSTPAPVLPLVAGGSGANGGTAGLEAADAEAEKTDMAVPLAATGAIAGLLGLGLGAAAFARGRRVGEGS